MAAETKMICMDTSVWMQSFRSRRFKKQADAIELYCAKKLNSHPQNVVGICGMGECFISCPIKPTRDLGKIMKAIYGDCFTMLQYKHEIKALGKVMKGRNLACDAVNFGDQSENKKELLDTLIVAADNNGNCHILHVEPKCSVFEEGGSSITAVGSLSTEDIQQAKLDTSTQEIVKLKLEVEKKKEQIDTLTRDNENLKQELELTHKDKIQVLSLIAMLYVLASKDTSAKPIPQIQWNFIPKPACYVSMEDGRSKRP
ncbi:26S proteasome non-ATPase regulatory subunit 4 [Tanacetum coccineum]